MRIITPWLIIIAFIGIAVFGFAAMTPAQMTSHGGCLAALSKGTACPVPSSANHDIAFHLSTFKGFSTAILAFANAAALIVFALYALWYRPLAPLRTAHINTSTPWLRIFLQETIRRGRAPILRFLALHEMRDPSAAMGAG